MRRLLIGCAILERELRALAADAPHPPDIHILTKALHDRAGQTMRAGIQEAIDAHPGYDAVLLGYALCGNGILGLAARDAPLVVPRAHDCITLLLGSRERHEKEVLSHPGTIFRSVGWVENNVSYDDEMQRTTGAGLTLDACIARYGEDNGRYLYDTLYQYRDHYSRLVYLRTELDPDVSFEQRAAQEAAAAGWKFHSWPGSLDWLRQLVQGPWSEDRFLTVPPGATLQARHDGSLIGVEEGIP